MSDLDRWWPEIAPILDERFWPEWWVKEQIESGAIGIVSNDRAIVGVERREYPGGAVELHGMFAAGDMSACLEIWDEVCAVASVQGWDVAAIESRTGWRKAFEKRGFALDRVRLVKELR